VACRFAMDYCMLKTHFSSAGCVAMPRRIDSRFAADIFGPEFITRSGVSPHPWVLETRYASEVPRLLFEFEHAASLEALQALAAKRLRDGWQSSGEPRQIEVKAGFFRRETRYAQTFEKRLFEMEVVPGLSPRNSLRRSLAAGVHMSSLFFFTPARRRRWGRLTAPTLPVRSARWVPLNRPRPRRSPVKSAYQRGISPNGAAVWRVCRRSSNSARTTVSIDFTRTSAPLSLVEGREKISSALST
jgi:hypothetical protein